MASQSQHPNPKLAISHRIWSSLLPHAVPDSRYNYDFSFFIPDFRNSSAAIDRLTDLPCYNLARTVFITPDNCLEQLRLRALKDGKKVLTTTYAIRRGFWLLDPRTMNEEKFEIASLLDGMEKSGIGRQLTWTQMQEEDIKVDLCATGAVAVNEKGVSFGMGHGLYDLEWGMLVDRKVVELRTPTIVLVHECQVIDGAEEMRTEAWDTVCDFVVTPERVIEVEEAVKPSCGILWDKLKPSLMEAILPLQELKGIQMMEKIMQGAGTVQESNMPGQSIPESDELMGIQMVERIMKGYKP
ncbi:hypothetical protein K469DRAFT_553769 [Zopfia rhizophila CBS 207.26]|uniref:5-formyltetrahydrofolate cyclo-ligase n=1 Tax=Zopfia rhizophila CBS 207.26 TaxID=1314779 RepID=A0A6A6EQR2_9PEZI|nr:hypothetical protein K469DRAFT_553769 [Zopfia rhizophila CBS 207.26]